MRPPAWRTKPYSVRNKAPSTTLLEILVGTTIAFVSGATSVGKSSATAQIATMIGLRGQQCRVFDLDSQATSSLWFGLDVDPEDEYYIGDVLLERPRVRTEQLDSRGKPVKRAVTVTDAERTSEIPDVQPDGSLGEPLQVPGVTVVPAASRLTSDVIEMATSGTAPLRSAIDAAEDVDVNLLDAPGAMDLRTAAAVQAADVIVIVVSSTAKQIALHELWDTLDKLRRRGASRAVVSALLPNIISSRRDGSSYREILDELSATTVNGRYAHLLYPPRDGETVPAHEFELNHLMLPSIRRQHHEVDAFRYHCPLPIYSPSAGVTLDYVRVLASCDERGITPKARTEDSDVWEELLSSAQRSRR